MKKIITEKMEAISKNIFLKFPKQISDIVSGRHGVYALYEGNELYYVGKAVDLKRRIKQHLKDEHKALWTHFSLFFTSKKELINIIESIIISIAQPQGNKTKPSGRVNNKGVKKLEEMIKEKQAYDRAEIFGKKFKNRSSKNKPHRPSLKRYFNSARPLKKNYKGKEYTAKLLTNGKIRFKGRTYLNPTSAAKQIIDRKTVNGWSFWFVKDEDGNWVKLSKLQ